MTLKSKIKPFALDTYNYARKTKSGKKLINHMFSFRKTNRKLGGNKNALLFSIKNINKFYTPNSKLSKSLQIKQLFEHIDINIPNKGFIVSFDYMKNLLNLNDVIDNISVDYNRILNNSLYDFKEYYNNLEVKNQDYIENQLILINAIEILVDREIQALKNSTRHDKEKYITFLENIKYGKVTSFEEALQRIIFYNQLFWQTGHELNGLGRLDKILNNIYDSDDSINKSEALYLIKEFLKAMHEYYWFKSNVLMGDTGQVIILGGKEEDGSYFYNDLTSLFIQANAELNQPDPKILLRVSKDTPRFLIEESLKSMSTGIGSPLLSNDDIVIPCLIDFGYDSEDAYNYVVSACWEPAPIAKGMEVNNVDFLTFMKPLNELLDSEDLNNLKSFEELLNSYKIYLKKEVEDLISRLNEVKWEEDPLLSLFIDNCDENQLDISKGGAKYNNIGITTVSLSNTINALFNINNLVFKQKKYTLEDLNIIRQDNFNKNEELLNELKGDINKFGIDDDDVIDLTNNITLFVANIFNQYTTPFGGKFKFGLSAPSYVAASETINASLDGRRDFEPFNVHISNENQDYINIMHFTSKLDYDFNRFNGNVVDLIATPNFIHDNFEKFTDFLVLSINLGFFQLQMNVLDSDTLIDAKKHPENHQNLIVRVWGFSAYFNDLPISYQDVLIERSLKNEGKI